jgi:hypothetical protein
MLLLTVALFADLSQHPTPPSSASARESLIASLATDPFSEEGLPGLEKVAGKLPLPEVTANRRVRLPGNGVYSEWFFDLEPPRQVASFEVKLPEGRRFAEERLSANWGTPRPVRDGARAGLEFRAHWHGFLYLFPDGDDGFSLVHHSSKRPRFAVAPRDKAESVAVLRNLWQTRPGRFLPR